MTADINAARRRWFAACREARIGEVDRKAIQARVVGKTSSSSMSVGEFNACLTDLKARGLWKPSHRAGGAASPRGKGQTYRRESDKAHIRKVFAIWSDMCRQNIPVIASRTGLVSFVQRMTKTEERPDGLSDPEWLSPEEANQVIEALKAWRARELAKRGR